MPRWSADNLADAESLANLGYWALDLDTSELEISDGLRRIHDMNGDHPGTLLDHAFENVHPADAEALRALIDTLHHDPEAIPPSGVEFEYRTLRPDGSIRSVSLRGRVEGRIWCGVAQDNSELRAAEHALAAHLAVNESLADWLSFDEGAVGLLRRLAQAVGCTHGAIWLLDPGTDTLCGRAAWSDAADDAHDFVDCVMGVPIRRGDGGPGRVFERQEPLIVADTLRAPGLECSKASLAARARSAMALPLMTDDIAGVLALYDREPRWGGPAMLRTLSSVGRQVGQFLVRHTIPAAHQRFSQRELEVLSLAASGHSGPGIARELMISPHTVKAHFENIYEKLGIGDRAAAVAYALRTGLIS